MAEEEKRDELKKEEAAVETEEKAEAEETEEDNDDEVIDETSVVDAIKKKKKWGIPVLILAITFVFMVLPAAVLIFSFTYAVPKKHLKEKIELGDKYITQLDYEKAILTYKEAIAMNPKSVAAYLGIADAYEGLANQFMEETKVNDAVNRLNDGIGYLEDGLDKTGSKEISDRLTELKLRREFIDLRPVALDEYPDGIREFLSSWCWYGLDEFTAQTDEELLAVVNDSFHLSFFCDYSVYPGGSAELGEQWADPRVLDADGVDWIMENVYNFDADQVKKIRTEDFQNKESGYGVKSWSYNAGNNTYETSWGGVGDGPFVLIDHVEKSGDLYYVQYDVYVCYQEENEPEEVRYAVLEEKTVDGSTFWSIHYDGTKPDFTFKNLDAEAVNAGNNGTPLLTEDEICNLAVEYYKNYIGYQSVSAFRGIVTKNENNMVTVCIYEEGYSAVSYQNVPQDWFCISQYTGRGDSTHFGKVDLLN